MRCTVSAENRRPPGAVTTRVVRPAISSTTVAKAPTTDRSIAPMAQATAMASAIDAIASAIRSG